MARTMVGVPLDTKAKANIETYKGALELGPRNWLNRMHNENLLARKAFDITDSQPRSGLDFPYNQLAAEGIYQVGYHPTGLGDSSPWANIIGQVGDELAKGVAGRIAGVNPWQTSAQAKPPVVVPPKSTTPSWLLPVGIGGVGLLALLLLRRPRSAE